MSKRNIENSDEEFLKNKAKRKNNTKVSKNTKKTSKTKKIFKVIGIVLLCIVFAVLGVYTYFKEVYKPDIDDDNIINNIEVDNAFVDDTNTNSLAKDRYSFLATGCDVSGALTDVIMVITYDVKNGKAAIMSIPRDTYVKVNSKLITLDNGAISKENFTSDSCYGMKINSAYAHGRNFADNLLSELIANSKDKSEKEIQSICKASPLGIDAKTLKEYTSEENSKEKRQMLENIRKKFGIKYLTSLIYYNFGVPCDFYAQVNISGFRNIVDAIDGVDVVIQEPMHYDDPYQDLHIHLEAGPQHLDGKKAEGFVRYRSGYTAADITRIDAQKIFMSAFIKKLCSLGTVTKISEIATVIQENLTTNISVSDAAYFATNILSIDLSNISMLTLPGASQYIGNVSYYLGNKDALMQTVNLHLNRFENDLGEEYFNLTSGNLDYTSGVSSAENINSENPDLGFYHPVATSPENEGTPDDNDANNEEKDFSNITDIPYNEDNLDNIENNNQDNPETANPNDNDTQEPVETQLPENAENSQNDTDKDETQPESNENGNEEVKNQNDPGGTYKYLFPENQDDDI